jgi:quinoprotein glucose dehydrogenase
MNRMRAGLVPAVAAALLACSPAEQDAASTAQPGDWAWTAYAADAASTKYAPLDQIDAANFGQLEIAWRYVSPDVRWQKALKQRRASGAKLPFNINANRALWEFQATPVMAGGVLYGSTSVGIAFAVDAATGEERWVYDPQSYAKARHPLEFALTKHRGVAHWGRGQGARVFMLTIDAWLIALAAETGRLDPDFGEGGRVDLMEGLRGPRTSRVSGYFQSSPPAVHRDVLIVGSSIGDMPRSMRDVPGDIRGYDARSGALLWTFHVVPAEGEPGTETWGDESWRYSGGANAWGPMSVDSERGLVYIPTSTPTNDLYGGHRPGDNLYAETLLCLDAQTGKRVWHQQITHHGLWDYDLAAPPNLVSVEHGDRRIDAVAQVTKSGFTFVFDRETGEPLWPIEERPVPASDVPGEVASATQPHPTRPPSFELQGAFESDLIDFTPELRAEALAAFRRFRSGPLYTPPSLGPGTLVVPGPEGGANWRGAGVDPETGVLYVPSITRPTAMSVVQSKESDMKYTTGDSLPQFVFAGPKPGPLDVPLFKPPFSRITAIDLNQGEILWQVANGEGPRNHPRLAHLDLPRLGSGAATCVLVTKTLVIAGDGADLWFDHLGEPVLWAYDKQTGDVVGRLDLPGKVRGCPATYQYAGQQLIVLPSAPDKGNPELIALALPR